MHLNIKQNINYDNLGYVTFEFLLCLIPLLTIRGYSDNNYITGFYIFILFLSFIIYNFLKDQEFIFYNFINWSLLIVWGAYILYKSPVFNLALPYYLVSIIIPFLIYNIFANINISKEFLIKFFTSLYITGSVISLFSIYIFVDHGFDSSMRITSFWEGFNMVSAYLMIIFLFNLTYIINNYNKNNILFYYISLIIVFIGLVLTQTRGVWLATTFAIMFYVIKNPKILIPFILLLLFVVFFMFDLLQTRILTLINFTTDASSIGRAQAWATSFILIKQNPLFGYGFESFHFLKDNVFDYFLIQVLHSHNTYLRTMVEMGLIGFILYFMFFVKAIYYSFKKRNLNYSRDYKEVFEGLQLTFIGLLIVFIFEPYFSIYDNSTVVIWFFISIAITLERQINKKLKDNLGEVK